MQKLFSYKYDISYGQKKMRDHTNVFSFTQSWLSGSPKKSINGVLAKGREQAVPHLINK